MSSSKKNRRSEYFLRQRQHLKYCSKLESVLKQENKLLQQMLECSTTASVDDCTNPKLLQRHMHMQGYIRFLQKKIRNTSD